MPGPAESPQQHYDRLAATYATRANVHAGERYRLECDHWLPPDARVLDVGCGTAGLVRDLRSKRQVLGIDLSVAMLAAGARGGFTAAASAERLPFADGSFDGAVAINLLEHVPEPGGVLLEIARVLRRGGRAVVTTPVAEWSHLLYLAERLAVKSPEGPHRFLSRRQLLPLAETAGLRPIVYRRILILPVGGRQFARAARWVERWTPGWGALHLLVAER